MKFTYCMRCDTVRDEEKNVCTVYGIDAILYALTEKCFQAIPMFSFTDSKLNAL